VNRTLQEIRKEGLLSFSKGHVEIFDWHAVADTAEFDPSYLLLDGPPQRIARPASGGEAVYVH